jgi:Ribonuclease G/E
VYDPSITRLDCQGHVWQQIENAGVAKDHVHLRKLLQGDVARAVVQQKEDLATLHPAIKVQQPESKDVLGHPCLCIGVITGAQRIAVDTLETAWIEVLVDDRQRNLLLSEFAQMTRVMCSLLIFRPSN